MWSSGSFSPSGKRSCSRRNSRTTAGPGNVTLAKNSSNLVEPTAAASWAPCRARTCDLLIRNLNLLRRLQRHESSGEQDTSATKSRSLILQARISAGAERSAGQCCGLRSNPICPAAARRGRPRHWAAARRRADRRRGPPASVGRAPLSRLPSTAPALAPRTDCGAHMDR